MPLKSQNGTVQEKFMQMIWQAANLYRQLRLVSFNWNLLTGRSQRSCYISGVNDLIGRIGALRLKVMRRAARRVQE